MEKRKQAFERSEVDRILQKEVTRVYTSIEEALRHDPAPTSVKVAALQIHVANRCNMVINAINSRTE